MKARFGCAGDSCIDYYDETGEAFPGGNPVNVAVFLRRFDMDASYVGPVGTDAFGALIRNELAEHGVDISHVRIMNGSTAVSHVKMEEGNRVFGEYEEGVMKEFSLTREEIAFLSCHDMVVTSRYGHAESALRLIHDAGTMTAYDAADCPFEKTSLTALADTDVFFFSDDQSSRDELMTVMKQLFEKGPLLVVAMRGAKGSFAYDGQRFYECAIVRCTVVDTMGAGDSYIAGFLAGWISDRSILECMEQGAAAAAVTIGYSGAWPKRT